MEHSGQLVLEGVTKDFVGLRALDKVSLRLAPGEILGLIGPNGSGKTTLINVVTGLLPASGGRVLAEGIDITSRPAWRITRPGIARTFQTIRLFRELSVIENVQVAAVSMGLSLSAARRRAQVLPGGRPSEDRPVRVSQEPPGAVRILASVGCAGPARAVVDSTSHRLRCGIRKRRYRSAAGKPCRH